MDPSVQGAGSQKSTPLVPWNHGAVKRFCPHCVAANETALWRRGNIRFLRMFPESAEALAIAAGMASEARRVVVIEDSTHEKPVVLTNIKVGKAQRCVERKKQLLPCFPGRFVRLRWLC